MSVDLLGNVFLWLSALSLAISFLLYIVPAPQGTGPRSSPRWAYGVSAFFLTAASVLLLSLLIRHRFDVSYVYGYTSRELPLLYLVSAFWAGPEGSFLLWATIAGWLGVLVAKSAGDIESPTMLFWTLAQGVLTIMLVADSPFALMAEPMANGQGLNPVLQDPWMAIHPPILFFGFAAMTAPAALAVGALISKKYEAWLTPALPWASFGWLTLGAGVVLGGVWAYHVLGWGGYWGWDPVENSSLVPWITGTVLLHGLILQKRKGTHIRANFIFAALTYVFVLYSTFLTRSGILGEFSVHSFAALGVANLLGSMLVLMTVGLALVIAMRYRFLKSPPVIESLDGKELNLYLTHWVLMAITVLVLVGTSMPVITAITNPERPSGVQQHFYNSTTAPFALALVVLLALAPLMVWSSKARQDTPASPRYRWLGGVAIGAAVASIIIIVLLGAVRGPLVALLILSLGAFFVNGWWWLKTVFISGVLPSSPYLAHAGMALMFVGIATSNLGTTDPPLQLIEAGPPGKALGWTVRLNRVSEVQPRVLGANVSLSSPHREAKEVQLKGSEMPGGGYAFKPFIYRTLTRDVYFAPEQIETGDPERTPPTEPVTDITPLANSEQITPALIAGGAGTRSEEASTSDGRLSVLVEKMTVEQQTVVITARAKDGLQQSFPLKKGQTRRVGPFNVQFQDFGPMTQSTDGGTRVAVILNVAPAYGQAGPAMDDEKDEIPGMNPEGSGAGFMVMRVSVKPFMSLLWAGVALTILGSIFAVIRRVAEARTRAQTTTQTNIGISG